MDSPATATERRHALLGSLARPVQHDINNLLTVVFANLDLLRRTTAEGSPRRQLDRVGEAARRLEACTRAILALTRRPVPDPAPFVPAAVIAVLQPLLALLVPSPGALDVRPIDPAGPAMAAKMRGDRSTFEDALLASAAAVVQDGRLALQVEATAAGVDVRLEFTGDVPPAAASAAALVVGAEFTASAGALTLHFMEAG